MNVLAFALLLAASDDVTLMLDISKGGDLRWKSQPCSATVTTGEESTEVGDATELHVAPGDVDILVACVANEGTLKKAVKLKATKDQTLKVAFDPGFITANIEREGHLSVGTIVVYDEADHEIARGKDRTVIPVPAGNVRVLAIIDKATAATSRDVRGEQRAKIVANQKTELKLDASDGELVVSVTENGRAAKALIALREPGSNNRMIELTPNTPTSVPAGTWDLVSQIEDAHDFREQLTKGVVITPRKRTTKTVNHATGKLVAVVTGLEKPKEAPKKPATPPADAPAPPMEPAPAEEERGGVVVDLLLPGATTAFNQIDPNSEARLTPGKYVVRATKDVVLDDGTKPTTSVTASVSSGGTTRVNVNPAVAHLDAEVRFGGEPRPLTVDLMLPGAGSPLVSRVADAKGAASFDVAPQALLVSTTLATPQGPIIQKKQVKLNAGNNRVRLDFDLGTAVIQVIDGGAAVTADVGFYTRLKSGKPDGEPAVAVKGGEEAFLAPGIYTLAVTRKGEQRLFGEVKVAAGRVVERSLDWSPPAPPVAKDEKKADAKKPDDTKKVDEKKVDEKKVDEKKADEKKDEKKPEPKPAPKEEKKPEPKK